MPAMSSEPQLSPKVDDFEGYFEVRFKLYRAYLQYRNTFGMDHLSIPKVF